MMKRISLVLQFAVSAALVAGCATLREQDAAREHAESRADHATCAEQGATFPGEAYTTCRRRIAELRHRKQWMELSLAQQQTAARTPDYLPTPPPGVYLPLDPARFACVAVGGGDDQVIVCKER